MLSGAYGLTHRKQRILQNRQQICPIVSPFIPSSIAMAAVSEMLWYQSEAVYEQIVMNEVTAS